MTYKKLSYPNNNGGLVISEIQAFRERAAKREKDKLDGERGRGLAFGNGTAFTGAGRAPAPKVNTPPNAPSGPKERVWGKQQSPAQQGFGQGPQGYNKPVSFIQGQGPNQGQSSTTKRSGPAENGNAGKTDEQLEQERKDHQRRMEDDSFRDVNPHPHFIYPNLTLSGSGKDVGKIKRGTV